MCSKKVFTRNSRFQPPVYNDGTCIGNEYKLVTVIEKLFWMGVCVAVSLNLNIKH